MKSTKNRSAAYPAVSIEEAFALIKKLHKALGRGPYDRLSAVRAIGYNSVTGTSAMKISALVHFGLLSRVGPGYKETELASMIISPINEEELKKSYLQSIQNPSLYKTLFNNFAGTTLPDKLDVVLHRNHRINERVSKQLADNFRSSAEYVGLLTNGYLKMPSSIDVLELESSSDGQGLVPNTVIDDNLSDEIPKQSNKTNIDRMSVNVTNLVSVEFDKSLTWALATGEFKEVLAELKNKIEHLVENIDEKAR